MERFSFSNRRRNISVRSAAFCTAASREVIFFMKIRNSSPPIRPTTSLSRIIFFMPYAISVKTMSPSIWPFVSLICLKLSVSIMKKAQIFSGFSSRYALICFSVSFLLYKPVSASRSARILRSSIACFLSSILKIMHRAFTGFSCRPHMATPWT